MKKLFLNLLFLTIVFVPSFVLASDVDYKINDFYIDAQILSDGDVRVCEYIEQRGTFNGYVREIFYDTGINKYRASNLSNLEVSAYEVKDDNYLKTNSYTLVNSASKGDRYKYTVDNRASGVEVTMYQATSRSSAYYQICYTLEDLILIHEDVAELYYSFIPDGFADDLYNVRIKVTLPGNDQNFRVWAHGPLYGNVTSEVGDPQSNSFAVASIDELAMYSPVALRLTFDKSLVPEGEKTDNEKALQSIIDEETTYANEANQQRLISRIIVGLQIASFVGYVIFLIIITIWHYLKHDKEYKTNFEMQYYRNFPNDYGPEILEYLLDCNITTKGYSACILNIIYKKGLVVEKGKTEKDYNLVKSTPTKELNKIESDVVDFLINEIGNGEKVSIKAIKNYGKSEKKAKKLLDNFNDFKQRSTNIAKTYKFFEEKRGTWKIVLILILGIAVSFFVSSLSTILMILTLVLMIVATVYVSISKKRTKSGALEYAKWMAFKRFLKDFGRMDEKELPEVILWDKYLVYATVLGVADELEKTMKIKIEAMQEQDVTLTDIYLTHYLIHANLTSSINRAVGSAVNTSHATIASSNSSSGGGYGGGFSGGGFGSGGGGGHGF